MTFKALVSPLAICAALAFGSGPAFAASINGVEIPADQLGVFQNHCETLAANDTASSAAGTDSQNTTTPSDSNSSDADNGSNAVQGETGLSGENLVVDIDTVNLAACQEAGLIDGSASASDADAMAPAANDAAAGDSDASTNGTMAPEANSESTSKAIDVDALTPSERTQLEDQCRAMQTDSDETSTDDNAQDQQENEGVGATVTATAELCAQIGLGEQ